MTPTPAIMTRQPPMRRTWTPPATRRQERRQPTAMEMAFFDAELAGLDPEPQPQPPNHHVRRVRSRNGNQRIHAHA